MLQCLISFLACITLRFLRSWTKHTVFCLLLPLGRNRARQLAIRCQERGKDCKQGPVLKIAFLEFHKVQCFFVLVFQSTALVALRYSRGASPRAANLFGATSWGQLINNLAFVRGVSVGNLLPLVFTLLSLHKAGVNSWFLLVLTTCASIASVSTWISVGRIDEDQLRPRVLVESCGYVDLLSYCSPNRQYLLSADFFEEYFGTSVPGLCAVTLILLYAHHMLVTGSAGNHDTGLPSIQWPLQEALQRWKTAQTLKLKFFNSGLYRNLDECTYMPIAKRVGGFLARLPDIVVELCFVYFYLPYLYFLSVYIADEDLWRPWGMDFHQATSKLTDPNRWTWGQIVAVTIWIPVFVEYFYLSICESRPLLFSDIVSPYAICEIFRLGRLPSLRDWS